MKYAIACILAVFIAGCGGSAPTLTFPQQVQIVCGLIQGEATILQSDGIVLGTPADQKTVTDDVGKVCTAGATVTVPNLQNLVNVTLPLIKGFVNANPAVAQTTKNEISAAIDTIILAVNTAVALAPTPVATPSPVIPASAVKPS